MPVRIVVQLATFGMDLIGLLTLIATSEVHPWTLYSLPLFLLFAGLARFRRIETFFWFRTTRLFFVTLILSFLAVALLLWLKFHFLLIVAVASSTPLLHASLWLIPEHSQIARGSQLRLALGFVELIMAAILTTGFYLTIAIFIFTLLASIAISCNFLDQVFNENKEPLKNLSSGYLTRSVSTAFLVLLSAALLFPILPRTHFNDGGQRSFRQSGYSEHVNYNALSSLFGKRDGQVMLRIRVTSSNQVDPVTLIPYGLLRTKVLNRFDGNHWSIGRLVPFQPFGQSPQPNSPSSAIEMNKDLTQLDFTRESMDSDALAVPYGTLSLTAEDRSLWVQHRTNGEWVNIAFKNRRATYHTAHHITPPYFTSSMDLPSEAQLDLFKNSEVDELKKLAAHLFSSLGKKATADRYVGTLNVFLDRQNYSVTNEARPADPSRTPLGNFLFVTKKGNSELFAGAAALLLRMAGVPTRLVTGFRISRGASDNTILVRSGDAHAWMEYWINGKGWRAFDPTPRTLLQSSLLERVQDRLQDLYDSMENFWYYYVYTYDARAQLEMGHRGWEKFRRSPATWMTTDELTKNLFDTQYKQIFVLVSVLAVVLVFGMIFLYFRPSKKGHRRKNFLWLLIHERNELYLIWERKKMERLLRKVLHLPPQFDLLRQETTLTRTLGEKSSQAYLKWRNYYLEARFGERSVQPQDGRKWLEMVASAFNDCRETFNLFRHRSSTITVD